MFVWNYFTNDARVKREGIALTEYGFKVYLIALKDFNTKSMKKQYKVNENFKVNRVEKGSIVLNFISNNKIMATCFYIMFSLISIYFVGIFFVMILFIMSLLVLFSKKFRVAIVKASTIIRMIYKGYKINANIYHANDLNTLLQAIICSKLRFKRKILIYDSHEVQSDRTGYNKKIIKIVEKILIKFTDKMIVENETRAEYNKKIYGFKPEIIHNYSNLYDMSIFPNVNIHKILGIDFDEKILLYQGGIQIGRGLYNLIDAMDNIEEGHLVFIGDGKEKNNLIKKANISPQKERIHFIDKVPLEHLPSYTKEAYIGFQVLENICFNHYSASSNKLFEYIMAGVPVIACDFPEISKVVIDSEVGLVIDSHSPREIAKGVNKIMKNKYLYEKFKENTIRAREIYNWENEKVNLANIYLKINKHS